MKSTTLQYRIIEEKVDISEWTSSDDHTFITHEESYATVKERLAKTYRGVADEFSIELSDSTARIRWILKKSPAEALRKYQEGIALAKQKSYSDAILAWKEAISLHSNNPDFYFNISLIYLELKEFEDGIQSLLKVLQLCPIYKRAYVVLGSAYIKVRKFDKAAEALQTALKFDPDQTLVHVNLGSIYSIKKNYHKAIRHFEKAISLNQKETRAYFGIAKVYLAQGDHENANRCFKVVIKLDPQGKMGLMARQSMMAKESTQPDESESDSLGTLADSQKLYQQAYQSYIQGNYQDSEEKYQRYLRARPEDTDVWASLAAAQLRCGHIEAASASIKKALDRSPNKGAFLKQAAIIYDVEGHSEAVIKAAEQAAQFGKHDSVTLALLGKHYLILQRIQEALKVLQEAVRSDPSNIAARYHYAQGLKVSGDHDAARQHFEEILWSKIDSPLKNQAQRELDSL